jgi:hypothetical protein
MSGLLTINGAWNGTTGLVGTPSDFPLGVNTMLQTYLDGISADLTSTTSGLENYDPYPSNSPYSVGGSGPNFLEEITNTNSTGSISAGNVSMTAFTVNALATQLVVQAPGSETISGNDSTSFAFFGANSSVDYTANGSQQGSIFAAGGADTVTLEFEPTMSAESIYSAGKDLLQLLNGGTDVVSVTGNANDTVQVQEADATVTATGNSTVNVYWYSRTAGGTLDFVNNSTAFQTVHGGIFDGVQSAERVTVDGGAGGGYYVAGSGGYSSLYGGTGYAVLVGAGQGDTLVASGNTALPGNPLTANYLYGGGATEDLIATSTSGANLFEVGYNYPGLSTPPLADGTISSQGSGMQYYFLGDTARETVYGSTALANGNFNIYNIVSDSSESVGGGNDYIVNFKSNGFLNLVNYADNAHGTASIVSMGADSVGNPNDPHGTLITLSDGTNIHLIGVAASSLHTTNGGYSVF